MQICYAPGSEAPDSSSENYVQNTQHCDMNTKSDILAERGEGEQNQKTRVQTTHIASSEPNRKYNNKLRLPFNLVKIFSLVFSMRQYRLKPSISRKDFIFLYIALR